MTQGSTTGKRIGQILLLFAFLVLLPWSRVFSAGTPAGTSICNQAHATYYARNGQLMPSVSSNAACVTVQQLGAVNITPATATRASQINTNVDYPSTVTNSGNGTDDILLMATTSLGFSALIYADANGNGVLDAAEIAVGTITQTGNLAADSSKTVITRVTIPNNITLNGQTDLLRLVGMSAYDPAAKDTGSYSTVIASAVFAVTKSVSNPLPRGGDRVTYTIAYTNSGIANASNVVVTDVLDNHVGYVTLSAVPAPVSVSGATIHWNLGTVVAGASGSIVFQVDIVNNAIPGTEIHNVAQSQYLDGPNTINVASTETNFITVQGGNVTVDFTPNHAATAEPGDSVDYAFTVTNNGVLAESFTLSYTSDRNLSWIYYHDANANGRIDSNETTTTATGSLPGSGGRYDVIARTILGVVPANGTVDITGFRVTSTTNAGNFKTTTGTTTIVIPVMTLSKLADAPDPRPGREIRFQITYANGGDGHAIQFAVTDAIPANTTYAIQSVKLNSIPKTDEADGDEVTVSGGIVTVNVGTVNPRVSGVIEFRVRIN